MSNTTGLYVNAEEISEFISNNFVSSDPLRKYWEGLSDSDKNVTANQVTAFLDKLPYVGRKMSTTQPFSLPRIYKQMIIEFNNSLLEGALRVLYQNTQIESSEAFIMKQSGISSYSIESSSVSFNQSASGDSQYATNGIPKNLWSFFSPFVY